VRRADGKRVTLGSVLIERNRRSRRHMRTGDVLIERDRRSCRRPRAHRALAS
jgi:hypothetical protein